MKKRILLISPYPKGLEDPYAYPPLGLLYLAANMHESWEPEVLIMESEEFNRFDFHYYGISVHSLGTYIQAKNLIKKIYRNNQDAIILVGGAGARMFEELSAFSLGAAVLPVPGEGEEYLGGVDVSELDNINFPARHLVHDRFIKHEGNVHHAQEPSTTIIATRGCVFNCGFCDRVTHGRKFRKRSIKNISEEIEHVRQRYDINWFRFIDDCITLDPIWFAELVLELGYIGVKWTCLSRSDTLTPQLARLMKDNGCQEVFFGFESGSQRMLDWMNKRTTVEKNLRAIKFCHDAGLTSCAYMMFGFPGENAQSVDETIHFLSTAKPDKSRLSTFLPIPGTDVWEHPHKYGVSIKNNYEDYWYYDSHDFGLDYKYIGNNKMHKLRQKLQDFYVQAGFTKSWTKTKEKA